MHKEAETEESFQAVNEREISAVQKSESILEIASSDSSVKPMIDLDQRRIQSEQVKAKGRLMPDSALTTYFGKPAFHTYGRVNTNPAQGGLCYGDYLKSHNINPHSGNNRPKTVQGYERTMLGNAIVSYTKNQIKVEH